MKRPFWPKRGVLFFGIFLFLVPFRMDLSGTNAILSWSFAKAEVYDYYLPYYLGGSGYGTGIAIKNSSTTDRAYVTVCSMSQEGAVLGTQVKQIPARGQTSFLMGGGEGWTKISSNVPLTGLAFIQSCSGYKLMFDMTLIPESATVLHVPHVAENPLWQTIVYVCNPNNSATSLNLALVSTEGTEVENRLYTIPANGSRKYYLYEFSGSLNTGSVEITASQGVAAFALYHNLRTGNHSYAGISAVEPEESPAQSAEQAILGNFTFTYSTGSGTYSERITIDTKQNDKTSEGTFFYEGYLADDPSVMAVGAWYPSKTKYVIEVYLGEVVWYDNVISSYTFSINPDNSLTGFYRVSSNGGVDWGPSYVFINSQSYKEPLGSW